MVALRRSVEQEGFIKCLTVRHFDFGAARGHQRVPRTATGRGYYRLRITGRGKTATGGNKGKRSARGRRARPRRSSSPQIFGLQPVTKFLDYPNDLWYMFRGDAGTIVSLWRGGEGGGDGRVPGTAGRPGPRRQAGPALERSAGEHGADRAGIAQATGPVAFVRRSGDWRAEDSGRFRQARSRPPGEPFSIAAPARSPLSATSATSATQDDRNTCFIWRCARPLEGKCRRQMADGRKRNAEAQRLRRALRAATTKSRNS